MGSSAENSCRQRWKIDTQLSSLGIDFNRLFSQHWVCWYILDQWKLLHKCTGFGSDSLLNELHPARGIISNAICLTTILSCATLLRYYHTRDPGNAPNLWWIPATFELMSSYRCTDGKWVRYIFVYCCKSYILQTTLISMQSTPCALLVP